MLCIFLPSDPISEDSANPFNQVPPQNTCTAGFPKAQTPVLEGIPRNVYEAGFLFASTRYGRGAGTHALADKDTEMQLVPRGPTPPARLLARPPGWRRSLSRGLAPEDARASAPHCGRGEAPAKEGGSLPEEPHNSARSLSRARLA